MINRAFIHITGQPGAGKTTLMEAILNALHYEDALCVHSVRDNTSKQPKESAPRDDPHLTRYRKAGAGHAMLYRFPRRKSAFFDEFFETPSMSEFYDVVLIEGDSPLGFLHLSAFVARPLPEGSSLLIAGMKDTKAQRERELLEGEYLADHPELLLELLPSGLASALRPAIEKNPDLLRSVGEDMRRLVEEQRSRPVPEPTGQWKLAESYGGIKDAGLVVVNIHDESERERAEAMVRDVARLRADKKVFDDVLGQHYHRTPVTAVVANLADPKDPGRKKVIARVKRVIAKGKEG